MVIIKCLWLLLMETAVLPFSYFQFLVCGPIYVDPSRWPRGTIYPQKLALTSPTSGGCSGTQTTEFCLFVFGPIYAYISHSNGSFFLLFCVLIIIMPLLWNYENGSTAVSINNSFKHTMIISVDACSAMHTTFKVYSSYSSWLQIRRPGFDSRHYQQKSNGSGTGSTQPREYNWGATW
jgi:hypothetical protein